MNEKHQTPAEALATEHARTIWWARHLTVHTRDPRLRGKKAPALHCGACQEVYAELEPATSPAPWALPQPNTSRRHTPTSGPNSSLTRTSA